MTKLYVASSWDHPQQPALVEKLRDRGFEVYNFREVTENGNKSILDQLEINKIAVFSSVMLDVMDSARVQEEFRKHIEKIEQVDACVLLLPCGRNAHMEASYLKGMGKKVYVFSSYYDKIKAEFFYPKFDGFYIFYENLFREIEKLKNTDDTDVLPSEE